MRSTALHVAFGLAALTSLASLACTPSGEEEGIDEAASEPAAAPGAEAVEAAEAADVAHVEAIPRVAWRPSGAAGERVQLDPSEAPTADARCAAGAPSTEAFAVDPSQKVSGGQILVQRGDAVMAMPLQKTRFDTVVVGTIAESTVTQVFHNPFDTAIEAVYTFPLPNEGAVDDYAIQIGKRLIRGEMKERGEAREIYEKAREEGRSAGLLEQNRPDVFTQSLANIPPGQAIEVTIHVVQPLHQEKGRLELVLPTVVGERYVPPDAGPDAGPDAARLAPPTRPAGAPSCASLEVSVAIEAGAGLPIQGLASRYHAVAVDRQEDGALVELARAGELLNRDVVLSWALRGDAPKASILAQPDRSGEGGHFTMTIVPPALVNKDEVRGRELVFVIDSSGSMQGPPIETAKATVEQALESMGPADTFQILNFAEAVSALGPKPLANTPANRARAREHLQRVASMGGTQMLRGINASLEIPHDPKRLRMVLFLTDGYIGNEEQIFTALDEKIGDARLFSLGVGASVNRHLLDGMATFGRGAVTYMGPGEAPKAVVSRFFERIDNPVLTDISIDWGEVAVDSVLPGKIPDLFAGQPVVIYGKYRGAPAGLVHLEGTIAGERVRIPVKVDFSRAENASGLGSMWARKQIDAWLGPKRFRDDADKIKRLVTDLAIERRIMTEYTAFVAVDHEVVVNPDGSSRTIQQKVEVPFGTEGVGAGESFGAGGLGLVGTGRGGGGIGGGTIGLGNTGLIGKGGGGGTGSGYGRGSGADFGGRGSRVPQVRQAKAEVTGSLDKDIIRRVIRAHINEVRACYNQGLASDPNLKGRLVVKFTIDAQGKVTKSEIDASIGDPKVDACMVKAVARWTFPKPPGGGIVNVVYPFVLEPG